MPEFTPETVAALLAATGIDPDAHDPVAAAADWAERTAFNDTLDPLVAGVAPVDPRSRFDPSWEDG